MIYNGETTSEAAALVPELQRFACATGLTFLQLALAANDQGVVVVSVEPYPRLEVFGDIARQQALEAITDILTAADQGIAHANSPMAQERSFE